MKVSQVEKYSMNTGKVPFLKFDEPSEAIKSAIAEVLSSGQYFNGAFTKQLVADFSEYIGMPYMVPTANCTDAIELVLSALELKSKDEVIVPAFTWFSDASMVYWVNAKLVFADIDLSFFSLGLEAIKSAVTTNTKVVILPHLFGMVNPEIQEIVDFCKQGNIKVIEDCAQAHGATLNHKKAGSFADVSVFSFYPTKNLGALGDAGCIMTKDETLFDRCSLLANHGQVARNKHLSLGKNSRLDELQAAVLAKKLPDLDYQNKKRIALAEIYFKRLAGLPISLPKSNTGHVYHQFVILYEEREKLRDYLTAKGIATDIHYPTALSDMPVLSNSIGQCPNATKASNEVLSLPIFPNHSVEEILYVCEQVNLFFSASDS